MIQFVNNNVSSLNEEYIIPGAFDERVCKAVAKAVAEESQK